MRQVGGQNPQRFEQREKQAGDDDERNDPEHLPREAGHEQQRQKRHHRRQDREDDGPANLSHPLHRAAQTVPCFSLMTVDVLADDDGVVDDDPEHQEEGEAGDHVHRHAQPRHQGDGPEERDRDAETDPEGEPNLEKQRQHDENENQPRGAVAQHDRQPIVDRQRLILPDGQRDAVGQTRADAVEVVVHGGRGFRRALAAGPEDVQHDGRRLIEAGALFRFGETVDDGRHVAQQQAGAVGPSQQHEVLVFGSPVGLPDGAQQEVSPFAAHRAAGDIERGTPHGVGHIVECQLVRAQRRLRHLDGDLVRWDTGHVHLTDLRQGEQFVAHLFGDRLQGGDVGGAGDGDDENLVADDRLADDRFFRGGRKRRDRLDCGGDLVQHALGVGAELDIEPDRRTARARRRLDPPDALDALDGLLDPQDDPGLHILGRRAEIGHVDADHIQIGLRKRLVDDLRGRHQAGRHDESHQEVGGDGVARQPFDAAVHGHVAQPPSSDPPPPSGAQGGGFSPERAG